MASTVNTNQKQFFSLRRCNNALSVLIIFIALYIGLSPFLPQIAWWIKRQAPVISSPALTQIKVDNIPTDNTLIIPRLDLKEKILDGESPLTVDKGIWRRPHTSKPPLDSNTVLVGHRFTYRGSAVFYNLDKIEKNDNIVVYWEGKKYEYKVRDIKIVKPTELVVEAPTDKPVLTLYTCAPLITAQNRLVIQADLVGDKP